MNPQATDAEVRKAVDEVFKQYDINRSGYLELEEMTDVIRDVFFSKQPGREVSNEDVKTVMNSIDRNHDSKVSRDELFIAIKRYST